MRKTNTIEKGGLLIGKLVSFVLVFLCLSSGSVQADKLRLEAKKESHRATYKLAADLPNAQQRVHRVGLMHLCVTNWGFFGSETRDLNESQGGCFNPNPEEELPAPSCEYPPNSDVEYLFQGGLWIGALVDDHPYTTVGCDGWLWINEMWSDAGEIGAIKEASIRPNSPCYSPDAVSEQDIIAVYTDTSADIPLSPWKPEEVDFDNRKHFPLGLQITQKSYSWSYEYAEDFVLIDFFIKNIGVRRIQDMYMGLYIDADVMHVDEDPVGSYGPQDDICGFKPVVTDTGAELDCADTVNLAWIADNDGHGIRGERVFTPRSPIAVTGTRVVRSPKPGLDYSFNWWISNQTGFPKDWGPWTRESQERWAQENCYQPGGLTFPDDVLGTPGGDCSKYFIMSNQEFDYDQIFACAWPDDHPEEGWLEPSPECADLANGYDTRYLLSFGPFEQIAPGESLIITIAYVAGADFHVDPLNLDQDPNMTDPGRYYRNLDFSDLETNAVWAAKVYDNPDLPDFACGDGIPDFKGPPPPPAPTLSFETRKGKVKVRWNGRLTEKMRDSFNSRIDFEGYRVYMSRSGLVEDYGLLGSYDKVDFKIYKLNRFKEDRPWEWRAASVSLDSLKAWLNSYGIEEIEHDPTVFSQDHPFVIKQVSYPFYLRLSDLIDVESGCAVAYDSIMLESFDSLYFEAQDWNLGFDDIISCPAYRDSVDRGLAPDTSDRYWDYDFEVEVFPSQPIWFAVTAFDVGDPQTGLPPLEASRLVNATLVYPIDEWETVKEEGLNVVVYPNPYRIDAGYSAKRYEEGGLYGRRIRFVNLPPRCTIRIYTLDGDLVRTIEHDREDNALDATYDEWDLISRNTQAVVSGIYLYSVEDKDTGENQVGKFVIIK
ncbi:MAG: hypothetical protein GTO24_05030 [candidate division Zixibacteria bacterium]|nr:hypothetical protein [candidate division Zixibacteria bacterium]